MKHRKVKVKSIRNLRSGVYWVKVNVPSRENAVYFEPQEIPELISKLNEVRAESNYPRLKELRELK
jgi:hypothetical protein